MNNKPITGTGKDDADIVPGIVKEATIIVSPEKAQKGKSKISEILQGKGTEIVVGGRDDLSELGSLSNAMAARQGIEVTFNVSIKNHMYLEYLFILLTFQYFSFKGSA